MKLYLIIAWDADDADASERRVKVRKEHLAGAMQLKETGNFILGGAMLNDNGDMIGSTMVLQFTDDDEFHKWKSNEIYILKGVWDRIEVHSFKVANV
ncbi:hypothetical protein A5893_15335 [Pedobacter psychrophilus]|uniref:YCII-related domain-containing protein n=1 Tax=Pedobacter psychrophilus TaxID=1826909 RepID=A0A179DBU7_9SPHI|nr:YciI family protein [Pedobacter psychrophilus]OAQ38170.1 hypothetical protein A5893_15335 [Pedobacter psychrophilus]